MHRGVIYREMKGLKLSEGKTLSYSNAIHAGMCVKNKENIEQQAKAGD